MSAIALILAAGEGTRMKSDKPKVAHEILGVPMVRWVVDAAREAGCERVVAVTGHRAEQVEALLGDVECVRQDRAARHRARGHVRARARSATSTARSSCSRATRRSCAPRRSPGSSRCASRPARRCTLLTTHLPDPTGYGRIVRDCATAASPGSSRRRTAPPSSARITEVNTGTYCFDSARALRAPRPAHDRERPGRVLPDRHGRGLRRRGADGRRRRSTDDPLETLGVNSRVQLAEADQDHAAAHQPRAHARRRHDDRPRSRLDRARRQSRPRRRAAADDVPDGRRPSSATGRSSGRTRA